jgi:hypothetical protein
MTGSTTARFADDIAGSVAIVTGGSRGLGLAPARDLARRGCRLVICARDEAQLNRAAERIVRAMLAGKAEVILTPVAQLGAGRGGLPRADRLGPEGGPPAQPGLAEPGPYELLEQYQPLSHAAIAVAGHSV